MFAPPFGTFTVIGYCARDRAVGIALVSSPLNVAARCPYLRPGVGAVSSQAFTNPALGPLALHLLAAGEAPEVAVRKALATDPHADYRQLGIVDAGGRAAAWTGERAKDHASHRLDAGCIAMGNNLAGRQVVDAIAEAFAENEDQMLEERLMRALEAGREAGGEQGGHLSGGLIVCDERPHPRADLRIDMAEHGDAVDSLRHLLDAFKPMIPFYRDWAENPQFPSWRDYYLERTGDEGPRAERLADGD